MVQLVGLLVLEGMRCGYGQTKWPPSEGTGWQHVQAPGIFKLRSRGPRRSQ